MFHIVRYNEKLNHICKKYNCSKSDIMNSNSHITNWDNINAGMRLNVPYINNNVSEELTENAPFVEEYYEKLDDKVEEEVLANENRPNGNEKNTQSVLFEDTQNNYNQMPMQGYNQQPMYNEPMQGYNQQPMYNEPMQGYNQQPMYNEPMQGYNQQPMYNGPMQGYNQQPMYNGPMQGYNQQPMYNGPMQGYNQQPMYNEPMQGYNQQPMYNGPMQGYNQENYNCNCKKYK